MKLLLLVAALLAAAAGSADAALLPGHPGDVMCFLWSMKYNYCFPVLKSDTNRDMASKEESCAAKNPGGGPDSWKTQTECCKEHGGCGYSGGPSGRECWAPDYKASRCVKKRLDEPGVDCNSGLDGGFQYEGICASESFAGGAAVQNRMIGGQTPSVLPTGPTQQTRPQVLPVGPSQQQQRPQVLPTGPSQQQQRPQVLPVGPTPQDKMAPGATTKPAPGGLVIEIKYSGKGNSDLGSGADIPSVDGKTPFTKVCGGVTKIIVACNQNKSCAAFAIETKDINSPSACGYLKRAGGKLAARQAWSTFVRS